MATIPYIKGFSVKPLRTTEIGNVIFTDGTNQVTPNQLQCEAYGYTYDKVTGTCSAFRYSSNLNKTFSNLNNVIKGSGNSTQTVLGEYLSFSILYPASLRGPNKSESSPNLILLI